MPLKVNISSKSGPYLEMYAKSVTINLVEAGQITILPKHTPLIGVVDISELKIFGVDNITRHFAISGGVLKISSDGVLILANAIESVNDIDFARATRAKERAEQRLQDKKDVDIKRAEAALNRALNRLNVYSKNFEPGKK